MESFLSLMSGPLAALLRYGLTAAGGAMVARGYVDGATAQAVVGGLATAIPAVIGALTSTKTAAAAKVLRSDGVGIKLPTGRVLTDPSQAAQINNSAMNDR